MKYYVILASSISLFFSNGKSQNPMIPPRGLGFQESVSQAKRQLTSFYAKDIPVKESISNLEEYYNNLEEDSLNLRPHINKLTRKPCKVLPDPQPGLVNYKLTDPIFRYHPIKKKEKFYGEFAPPVKEEFTGNQYPINPQNYQNQNYSPSSFQNSDPFYGYKANYQAKSEYFEPETVQVTVTEVSEITPTPTIFPKIVRANDLSTNNWQSSLYLDYASRLASMSSALASNSEALSSISFNNKLMSMNMFWASKEASLMSKLATYSATATTTRQPWHW